MGDGLCFFYTEPVGVPQEPRKKEKVRDYYHLPPDEEVAGEGAFAVQTPHRSQGGKDEACVQGLSQAL